VAKLVRIYGSQKTSASGEKFEALTGNKTHSHEYEAAQNAVKLGDGAAFSACPVRSSGTFFAGWPNPRKHPI
jgi:hypothetical protein